MLKDLFQKIESFEIVTLRTSGMRHISEYEIVRKDGQDFHRYGTWSKSDETFNTRFFLRLSPRNAFRIILSIRMSASPSPTIVNPMIGHECLITFFIQNYRRSCKVGICTTTRKQAISFPRKQVYHR